MDPAALEGAARITGAFGTRDRLRAEGVDLERIGRGRSLERSRNGRRSRPRP